MADLGDFTAAVDEHDREQGEVDTFTFFGKQFALADRIGSMPFMKYAAAADSGLDSAEMSGQAAMYDLIRQCLTPEPVLADDGSVIAEGWPAFERLCIDKKVRGPDLLGLVAKLMQAMTGKASRQPSDSPTSEPATSPALRSVPGSWDEKMRAEGMLPVDEAAAHLAAASSG
jgi:hypothetical protein